MESYALYHTYPTHEFLIETPDFITEYGPTTKHFVAVRGQLLEFIRLLTSMRDHNGRICFTLHYTTFSMTIQVPDPEFPQFERLTLVTTAAKLLFIAKGQTSLHSDAPARAPHPELFADLVEIAGDAAEQGIGQSIWLPDALRHLVVDFTYSVY